MRVEKSGRNLGEDEAVFLSLQYDSTCTTIEKDMLPADI